MTESLDYGIRTYGDQIADVYDRYHGAYDPATIAVLKDLAGGGRVLELGIGTGRVALPLREAGVDITGIDASPEMVAKLRSKPGGSEIPVVMGDFADVGADGEFALIYVVFNTLFNLQSQADQVRCFRNATAHLAPGGRFVLELFVPDLGRFRDGQDMRLITQDPTEVRFDVAEIDTVRQLVVATHVSLGAGGPRFFPVRLRYAWPSELDLMGQLAGLALEERWGGWDRRPFTQASKSHISVYGRS
jgi:SAM-dependent methyltransferase